jgi:hypothetical protein
MPDRLETSGATGAVRRFKDMGDGTFAEVVSFAVVAPNVFRSGTFTALGDTALWTPAAGKRWRLMRYRFALTGNAAMGTGGVLSIMLRDATAASPFGAAVYVPAVAANTLGAYTSPWIDLGTTGYLSAAANNVLNVNLSAALTGGQVRVLVAGVEE